jgi:nitrite reductase/ring-hydroxylating ferredoxin subunit
MTWGRFCAAFGASVPDHVLPRASVRDIVPAEPVTSLRRRRKNMSLTPLRTPHKVKIATWSTLPDRKPTYALVADVDLVVIRHDDSVSVLYGRCLHRGALMSDGHIDGQNLICGVHGWDYRYDTGVSSYNNAEALPRFQAFIEDQFQLTAFAIR